MKKTARGITHVVDLASGVLTRALWWLAAIWLLIITTLVTFDAVRRAIGAAPLAGVPSFAALSVVGISFLAFPYAARRGVQVATPVLYGRLPVAARRVADIGIAILGIVLFGLLAAGLWDVALDSVSSREFVSEGSLRIPVYPVKVVLLVVAVAMILENLRFGLERTQFSLSPTAEHVR